jgi:hypothetical protein
MSREELKSKFEASRSLAVEVELFYKHLDGHRYLLHFIDGHNSYLQRQGTRIQADLADAIVRDEDGPSLNHLRADTGRLLQVIMDLRSRPSSAESETEIKELEDIQREFREGAPQ